MSGQPTLQTQRLMLRPFSLQDVSIVTKLAGEKEIAATTLFIPHPYEEKDAREWISTHAHAFQEDKAAIFAIVINSNKQFCGAIGLGIDRENDRAEMGYWIGKPYWNKGYCTEAAKAILRYGFTTLKLHRICADHFKSNPASGRVMKKIGMVYEGCRRHHVKKWEKFEDLEQYGLLNTDWQKTFGRKLKLSIY